MIEITRLKSGVKLSGHANYAPMGRDIVCAAVSALIQTLIQSIEELTEDTIEYSMQPGAVDIKFWSLSEQSRVLVDSFFIGVENIAAVYPENVRIV